MDRKNAPNNRTITLSEDELKQYSLQSISLSETVSVSEIEGRIIQQNFFDAAAFLPDKFVDLLFIDPPYNLNKTYKATKFKKRDLDEYTVWFDDVIKKIVKILKY